MQWQQAAPQRATGHFTTDLKENIKAMDELKEYIFVVLYEKIYVLLSRFDDDETMKIYDRNINWINILFVKTTGTSILSGSPQHQQQRLMVIKVD